jgi:broad specificity phosphatase PhoE
MAELYLIRHAQASFGTGDYDRLSELGCRQAKLLGEFLHANNIQFDVVYTGELLRQRQTAELACAPQSDVVFHEPDARLNEIESDQMFAKLVPELARTSLGLEDLVRQGKQSSKHFQKALEIVFNHWVQSKEETPGLQSWADYSRNVHNAIREITVSEGSGKSVAVFTSGGTIATIVAQVLRASGGQVYKFYEPLMNCSVTRLLYSGDKISLSSFNDHFFIRSLAEQTGEALLTYR